MPDFRGAIFPGMSAVPQLLEVTCGDLGLRVSFTRSRDRFGHEVSALFSAQQVPLLASQEGTDVERWPASPPLQQLSVEHRRDGQHVALAVGMAGNSHWSLSVQLQPERLAIEFDAACRCSAQPERLGSAYVTLVPFAPQGSGLVWMGDSASVWLEARELPVEVPATRLIFVPEAVAMVRLEPGREPWSKAPFSTVRWRYAIRLVPS